MDQGARADAWTLMSKSVKDLFIKFFGSYEEYLTTKWSRLVEHLILFDSLLPRRNNLAAVTACPLMGIALSDNIEDANIWFLEQMTIYEEWSRNDRLPFFKMVQIDYYEYEQYLKDMSVPLDVDHTERLTYFMPRLYETV